ncbi:MAG: hypothetical protein QOJ16_4295 [Acidobacteriota bacterium]|nr:hypothetical protein [Acidobacteriota bacterium]
MRSPLRSAGIAALLLLLAAGAAQATLGVRSSLSPEVVGVDEGVTFSIEVHGGGFSHLAFKTPSLELENLEIAAGPFQSESISFVNGNFSRSFKLSWELRPLGVGRARVHALSLQLGEQTIELPAREVRVQQEPTRPPADQDQEPDPLDRFFGGHFPLRRLLEPTEQRSDAPRVFLRAEVTPERPVVGEQALYTVSLYTRDDVNAVNPRSLPTFKGFWVRDIPQPQNLPTEMVDMAGARYGRVVLLRKALFSLRPGRHAIEPAAVDVIVRTLERTFFGPALERPEEVQLHTKGLTVDVQPLPPGPPGFRGAVGRMALSAALSPHEVRVGEAAALTLTLAGEGNLQGVTAPALAPAPGLKVLPPQQEGSERLAGDAVRGVRTWTYAVIPERAGSYQVSAPPIPYFDPGTHAYHMAAASPLALTVLPPAQTAAASPARSGGVDGARAGRDWRGLLPWLALPLGVALVLTLVRRRHPRDARRPRRARVSDRPSARRLEERLREAEAEGRPRQAAAHIEAAWRDFLAESWKIPAASPTPRWREIVMARGADPEAARELGELADDLQYLRQAPQLSAAGALQSEALARSRRLLRRL